MTHAYGTHHRGKHDLYLTHPDIQQRGNRPFRPGHGRTDVGRTARAHAGTPQHGTSVCSGLFRHGHLVRGTWTCWICQLLARRRQSRTTACCAVRRLPDFPRPNRGARHDRTSLPAMEQYWSCDFGCVPNGSRRHIIRSAALQNCRARQWHENHCLSRPDSGRPKTFWTRGGLSARPREVRCQSTCSSAVDRCGTARESSSSGHAGRLISDQWAPGVISATSSRRHTPWRRDANRFARFRAEIDLARTAIGDQGLRRHSVHESMAVRKTPYRDRSAKTNTFWSLHDSRNIHPFEGKISFCKKQQNSDSHWPRIAAASPLPSRTRSGAGIKCSSSTGSRLSESSPALVKVRKQLPVRAASLGCQRRHHGCGQSLLSRKSTWIRPFIPGDRRDRLASRRTHPDVGAGWTPRLGDRLRRRGLWGATHPSGSNISWWRQLHTLDSSGPSRGRLAPVWIPVTDGPGSVQDLDRR